MPAANARQLAMVARFVGLADKLYGALKEVEEDELLNAIVNVDWNTITFTNVSYDGPAIANFLGSVDWFRKLMRNESMTGSQGDHLSNVVKISTALGA